MATARPLSFRELLADLPGCRAFAYHELARLRSLDDLLGPPGGRRQCVLLYELNRPVGHFIGVLENREGVQVFDPLGFGIDDELALVRPDLVKETHQDYPHLARLLVHTRRPVVYSPYPLQKRHTSTCGMWVWSRLKSQALGCDEFASAWVDVPDRDEAVADLYTRKALD